MQRLTRSRAGVGPPPPAAILQFGGGNFLRGFIDWIVHHHNQRSRRPLGVIVANNSDRQIYRDWVQQDGLYHLVTRGLKAGRQVDRSELITCIYCILAMDREWDRFLATAEDPAIRFVVSNTTEAGFAYSEDDRLDARPPAEFPAKLTAWLFRRFRSLANVEGGRCYVLPTELVDDNGPRLRDLVLRNAGNWDLEPAFLGWLDEQVHFCSTLVDRIVPGIPPEQLEKEWKRIGYRDAAMTQGEPYHLWAIDGPAALREALPLDEGDLNVVFTDNLTPYRRSKVAILNGAHTAMVPVGYLSGLRTVGETLEDPLTGVFVRQLIHREIIPTLDLPSVDLDRYTADVLDRFGNPFIRHELASISLNSVAKFRTRLLPAVLTSLDRDATPPPRITLSWAALLVFYRGADGGVSIPLRDAEWVISYIRDAWAAYPPTESGMHAMAARILAWERAWGTDLSRREALADRLAKDLLLVARGRLSERLRELVET